MHKAVLVLAAILAGMYPASQANATILTLGEQDFANGSFTSLGVFNTAGAGEPAPFDLFRGNDPIGPNFSESWTFSYSPGAVTSASISIGIFDHDSFVAGNQVASFSVDGFDLTALLNALFEGSGGAQTEYNVYTLALPAGAFAALSDGSATFSLTLQGSTSPPPFNGAGLDFSTLDISNVPEPGTLGLLGVAAAGFFSSRRWRSNRGRATSQA